MGKCYITNSCSISYEYDFEVIKTCWNSVEMLYLKLLISSSGIANESDDYII